VSRERLWRLASLVVLGLAVGHAASVSWRAWGDLVVDIGRELEVARQVAAGEMLYRDVRWYYGPLAPYVNAGLYRLFGVHAGVLMAAGAASAVAMALMLRALATERAGALAGTATAVAFVYLCGFAHLYAYPPFNWIMPYNYSATYGMLAATASLWLLVRHADHGRPGDLLLSTALLAAAALSKVETFVPIAAAHVLYVAAARPRVRGYVVASAGVLAMYAFFWAHTGPALVSENLWGAVTPRARTFILRRMGLLDPVPAIAMLVRSMIVPGGVVAFLWALARLARGRPVRWAVLGAAAALPCLAYAATSPFRQLRFLPVALLALLVWHATRALRDPDRARDHLAEAMVLVFAIVCLVRTPLLAGAFHYGFYLLPVPLLAFAVAWFRTLPEWLPGVPRALFTAAGLGIFAGLSLAHHVESSRHWTEHTALVDTPRGRMYLLADFNGHPLGSAQAHAVHFLASRGADVRVLAVPEGAGLAFMAGAKTCCGMHSYLPLELDGPFDDTRLLARVRADPPDFVIRVDVDLAEYGSAGFGVDYAIATDAWLRDAYRLVATFGDEGYIRVFERRH
jgi:hypothetical protein